MERMGHSSARAALTSTPPRSGTRPSRRAWASCCAGRHGGRPGETEERARSCHRARNGHGSGNAPPEDHLESDDHALTWAGAVRAGEGNRTLMTSLEGWGSAIELRPRRETAMRSVPPATPRIAPARRVPGLGRSGGAGRRPRCQPEQAVPCDSRTGCGAAWLARLLWEQEAPGSNPGIPTRSAGHGLVLGCEEEPQDHLTVSLTNSRASSARP
jgi:hypothetical protein